MAVLTNIPNNTSARDWRDTVNALIKRIAALEAAGVPVETPAPAFTTQPSVSPTSGTAGSTVYAATPGTVSNGSVVSRVWLLNGTAISSGVTALPASSGTLAYQETASGPGGTTTSTVQVAAVTAAAVTPTPAPSFTSQPSISPTSGTAGTTTFTATPGNVSNGSITARSWTINGTVISTGITAAPASSGTLTYQETATGSGGTTQSTVQQVTVATAAAAAPAFTSQPTVSPSTGTAGTTTYTATPGAVSNGTITSRAWALNGSTISTGLTAAPAAAGTLTYQEFATGSGGSASSSVLTRTVSAATPTLTLSPASISIASNAAAGTTVSNIANVPAGVTPSITPNDGRLVIAGDASAGWKVVVGMSALSAGTINFSVAATGATGASGVLTVTTAATSFTMTQLPVTRTYQRTTTTGGGQGKGAGTIPHTINVTTPGSVYARCRSASDGTTILQASRLVGSTTATGSQTFNVTGVDARLGRFYVDLSGDGSTWTDGTVPVAMGRIILVAGQSLAVRCFNIINAPVVNYATLGVTVPADALTYASVNNDSGSTLFTPAWIAPSDSGNVNSAFTPSLIGLQEAASGVTVAVAGHARGSTPIAQFVPGGAESTRLRQVIDDIGGFEAFYWFQGHSDAQQTALIDLYQSQLTALFTDVTSRNVARGNNYQRYVSTVPNITSTSWGGTKGDLAIRAQAKAWADANNATIVDMNDVQLYDTVHQDQYGSLAVARHLHRATRPAFGLAGNDAGPSISSVSRNGAAVTVNFSMPAGATTLVPLGNVAARLQVFQPNTITAPLALDATTPYVVNAMSVVLNLAAVPADAPLDLWYAMPIAGDANAWANGLYDNHLDNDGITIGRHVVSSTAARNIKGSTLGPNLTDVSTTYAAGPTGFGQVRTGGYGQGVATNGSDVLPIGDVWTVECRFQIGANPTALKAIMGIGNRFWFGVATDGRIIGNYRSTTADTYFNGTTNAGGGTNPVVADGLWHHVAMVANGSAGVSLYLDGALIGVSASPGISTSSGNTAFNLGGYNNNSSLVFPGSVDEAATFNRTVRYTGNFTPAGPYANNEPGIFALYHADGNVNAAAA